jgi:hypothetical protein
MEAELRRATTHQQPAERTLQVFEVENLAIMTSPIEESFACALCGELGRSRVPFDLFHIENYYELCFKRVCWKCGEKHAIFLWKC